MSDHISPVFSQIYLTFWTRVQIRSLYCDWLVSLLSFFLSIGPLFTSLQHGCIYSINIYVLFHHCLGKIIYASKWMMILLFCNLFCKKRGKYDMGVSKKFFKFVFQLWLTYNILVSDNKNVYGLGHFSCLYIWHIYIIAYIIYNKST